MESARSYRETSVTFRRFTIADYRQDLAQSGGNLNTAVGSGTGNAQDTEKKPEKKADENVQQTTALQDWQGRLQKPGSNVLTRSNVGQTLAKIRQTTIRYIFDILFSARKYRFNPWMQGDNTSAADEWSSSEDSGAQQQYGQQAGTNDAGTVYGNLLQAQPALTASLKVLNYSQDTLRIEAEDTAFSTVGTVRTADGREINFNVNVGMSREFQQHFVDDLQLSAFKMCDPLVINLDTDTAEFSDQTFYFDIDADGEKDEISRLGAGSGYLALDKNGDGQINDGSELFGTASGNGFADLAEYDEDGNGWIDENDAIWDKLKIWVKDKDGNDVLYRLADKGVGAICLQNVSTDFTLKGQGGQTRGAVRSSGVFLYENGNVGTVQHVDVAKYDAQA